MNQISYTFLIIFQVSIILIDFFIIKISFDWGKDETAIENIYFVNFKFVVTGLHINFFGCFTNAFE